MSTQQLVRELIAEIEAPLLIDGDGITAVSAATKLLKGRKNKTVLTPHMGEMSRLTDQTVSEIMKNPIDILQCAPGSSIQ